MTNAQRITLRLSEVRSRLNEIAGLEGDAFTPEIRGESEKLTNEYGRPRNPSPCGDNRGRRHGDTGRQ